MTAKHYTVTAVFRGDEVLMQYKLRGPFTHVWNLPGGKVEKDEDLLTSACREVNEEAAIDIGKHGAVHIATIEYRAGPVALLEFFASLIPDNFNFVQTEDEPLCWVKRDLIKQNIMPTAGYLNVPHFIALAESVLFNKI